MTPAKNNHWSVNEQLIVLKFVGDHEQNQTTFFKIYANSFCICAEAEVPIGRP